MSLQEHCKMDGPFSILHLFLYVHLERLVCTHGGYITELGLKTPNYALILHSVRLFILFFLFMA